MRDSELRFLDKDGERILQQLFVTFSSSGYPGSIIYVERKWRDVPTISYPTVTEAEEKADK